MNCKKRITECWLYDEAGSLLSYGKNQCFPPYGECLRLNINQGELPQSKECGFLFLK